MDWLGAVMNAVSLAAGVAAGSVISYFLLRREAKGLVKELVKSELYIRLNTVLKEANEVLSSEEAKLFFKRLATVMESFVASKAEQSEPLLKLPQKGVEDEG